MQILSSRHPQKSTSKKLWSFLNCQEMWQKVFENLEKKRGFEGKNHQQIKYKNDNKIMWNFCFFARDIIYVLLRLFPLENAKQFLIKKKESEFFRHKKEMLIQTSSLCVTRSSAHLLTPQTQILCIFSQQRKSHCRVSLQISEGTQTSHCHFWRELSPNLIWKYIKRS